MLALRQLKYGDAHTDNDFEIKKMLISLASGGTDEAQTSSLTKISIKHQVTGYAEKSSEFTLMHSIRFFFKQTNDTFSNKKIDPQFSVFCIYF